MRILVTGGGGFAGRHLLRELLSLSDAEISATVLDDPEVPQAGDPLAAVRWLPMDLSSPESVREVVDATRPTHVFHLAGQASVGRSLDAPLATWDVNATGTVRLMAALEERGGAGARLLLVSSAEVYGVVPSAEQPIGEDRVLRPVTPYGASKVAAEVIALQMGSAMGAEVVVARSFNHIGPGQDERFVLPSIALQLMRIRAGRADPVIRVGNLEVERDLVDVRDVARAYVMLAMRGESGTAYNIASGTAKSLLPVVQRLIELSGTGVELEIDPDRLRSVDIPTLAGDAHRVTALGWSPRYDLDQTLQDLLDEANARL